MVICPICHQALGEGEVLWIEPNDVIPSEPMLYHVVEAEFERGAYSIETGKEPTTITAEPWCGTWLSRAGK